MTTRRHDDARLRALLRAGDPAAGVDDLAPADAERIRRVALRARDEARAPRPRAWAWAWGVAALACAALVTALLWRPHHVDIPRVPATAAVAKVEPAPARPIDTPAPRVAAVPTPVPAPRSAPAPAAGREEPQFRQVHWTGPNGTRIVWLVPSRT